MRRHEPDNPPGACNSMKLAHDGHRLAHVFDHMPADHFVEAVVRKRVRQVVEIVDDVGGGPGIHIHPDGPWHLVRSTSNIQHSARAPLHHLHTRRPNVLFRQLECQAIICRLAGICDILAVVITRRSFLSAGLVLAISVVSLLSTAPASGALNPVPDQLTDEAFWSLISDLSEDGGYFRFENFLSNEPAFQYVISDLKQITKPGGVYVGVGPEQNFTYLVALEPKIAFIVDIRRQNMLEHLMYKALFELSADRAEFLSKLFSRKRPDTLNEDSSAEALFTAYQMVDRDPQIYKQNVQDIKDRLVKEHKFGLSADDLEKIQYVYSAFFSEGPYLEYSFGGYGGAMSPTYADLMTATDETGKNRSYLATEENFRIVKAMERKNLIVPLVGDFAGPKTVRKLGQYLKDHEATVTAFYTSNVEQYLFQQASDWKNFYSSVATLPMDASSTFIRSVNGGSSSRAYGFRFQSLLSSMPDLIKQFQEGTVKSYYDVVRLSK
jgi:hypothetical protein